MSDCLTILLLESVARSGPYGVLWQPRTRSAKSLWCSLATKVQRVSTVREENREKHIFSRSGICQGILKSVREKEVREIRNNKFLNELNIKN